MKEVNNIKELIELINEDEDKEKKYVIIYKEKVPQHKHNVINCSNITYDQNELKINENGLTDNFYYHATRHHRSNKHH